MHILDFMKCELQYNLTPLPELCRKSADEADPIFQTIFTQLASCLEANTASDVSSCMDTVMAASKKLTPKCFEALDMLGDCLGRFDLEGQLHGLDEVRTVCARHLDDISKDKPEKTRRYQTLGLCAGAALIIIFM